MNEADGDLDVRGVVVPILTPLKPDEEVDVASLRRLTNYVIGGGVHGIWRPARRASSPRWASRPAGW